MGKAEVRVVAVNKVVTALLIVLVSAAIASVIYTLSGRAYVSDAHPLRDLAVRVLTREARPSKNLWIAGLMPVIGNALLYAPWGFFAFLLFDRPERTRRQTYVATVGTGLLFALAMTIWQQFLPTRVTAVGDLLANLVGIFAGASLGHVRKELRIRFE